MRNSLQDINVHATENNISATDHKQEHVGKLGERINMDIFASDSFSMCLYVTIYVTI